MQKKSELSIKAAYGKVPDCPWCMSSNVTRNQPVVGESVSALSCDDCDAIIPEDSDWYWNREKIWTVARFEEEDDDDDDEEESGLAAFM